MIAEILSKQLVFEGADNKAKFLAQFNSLYRIELFKNGLDLVLTKVRQGDLKFIIKIIKGWDTDVGCCLTEQNKVYNKILKVFTNKLSHTITIRNLATEVMAHEMGHALAYESGLILNEDFRTAIGYDLKGRQAGNIALRSAINKIMIEGVKSYPADKIIGELFVRYFEILSLSRNVKLSGDFTTSEVMDFFSNSTKWLGEIFNQKIISQIDADIAQHTAEMISKNGFEAQKKFTENVDSFYKKIDNQGKKTWSANTKSNAAWLNSWQNHEQKLNSQDQQKLLDNKDKK